MENKEFKYNGTFQLEKGGQINGIKIAYTTFGNFKPQESKVIWICHALTANSEACVWWEGLVGKGKLFDPDKYFIICANILGSCYGTTGPLEINSDTGEPWYLDFPEITIRDMVGVHEILRTHLGIDKIYTCIGGSLGGQQAVEWAIINPGLIENLILLATNAVHSPWGIAFNEAQRMAIKADNTWTDKSPFAGIEGLKAARAIALLSYRNYNTYKHSQSEDSDDKLDDFRAISYQNYQGEKLVKRFSCHSYWHLSKAMDCHNVGRGRGGVAQALSKIKSKTLAIGIKTDVLFPVSEQILLADHIPGAQYSEIESLYGHDGFLIETVKISEAIEGFFKGNRQVNSSIS
ncbi:homoserine O-acetyltransferase [Cytophagaceae bacterium ABcell3]|nr:homoserine O-acetyltransferase [Cytophagaceae bacterium ABcell3]